MRTIATTLAMVLLSASSIAIAQEGPRGGGGLGGGGGIGGGGPALERGGGGGPARVPDGGTPGGGGPGISERGAGPADAGPPSGEGPRVDRAEKAERSQPRQSEPKGKGPSERRASKRDDVPDKGQRKASEEGKSRKSQRASDDDKPSEKSSRAADKAGEKVENKDEAAAKPDDARAQQAETDRRGKDDAKDAAKRVEGKPAGDNPGKRVNLTDAKRDNLRGAFRKEKDLKPRAHVDVAISIGRRLPRDWDYRPVPVTVIEIVPEYRDYVFVYADDDYVICDPDTYEIVAVVPADDRQYAGGGSGSPDRCPARLSLTRDERELILDEVRIKNEVDVRDLEVGWSVPSNVELLRFPDVVLSKADELSGCRYFIARDQLAIVDPIDEKVVLVIDKG